MADVVVRPTTKFIKAGYVAVLLLTVAAFLGYRQYMQGQEDPMLRPWAPAVILVLLLWPFSRQMRRLASKLTISTDKLRYETGFLAKSTRTIQVSKIQDIRVDQTFGQRIFGVGSLSIETAGEASRLTIHHIDRAQAVADEIMERSQKTTPGSNPLAS